MKTNICPHITDWNWKRDRHSVPLLTCWRPYQSVTRWRHICTADRYKCGWICAVFSIFHQQFRACSFVWFLIPQFTAWFTGVKSRDVNSKAEIRISCGVYKSANIYADAEEEKSHNKFWQCTHIRDLLPPSSRLIVVQLVEIFLLLFNVNVHNLFQVPRISVTFWCPPPLRLRFINGLFAVTLGTNLCIRNTSPDLLTISWFSNTVYFKSTNYNISFKSNKFNNLF